MVYLERRTIIAGPRAEVEREYDIDVTLGPQDERVGRVEREARIDHVQMFLAGGMGLIDTVKIVCKCW